MEDINMTQYVHEVGDYMENHKQAIFICGLSGAVVLATWWWRAVTRDLPPGPRLLWMTRIFRPRSEEECERGCLSLRDHGEIVSTMFFTKAIIILNSYEAIKEAYVDRADNVSGRPKFKMGTRLDDESAPGLVNAEGQVWQEHRRFVLSSLRDFGFGKRTTESIIQEELEVLCKFIEESGEGGKKGVDLSLALSKASTNVICSLVFGQRCGTEQEFEEIVSMLRQNRQSQGRFTLVTIFLIRLLKRLPGDFFKLKLVLGNVDKMFDYVTVKINAHREKHTEGNDNDLIDSYLTAQAQREREYPSRHSFTDSQLTRIIFELFLAGTDTTSTTLRWFFYTIAQHPDIQDRVQRELDEVLGQRVPNASDRSKLKYTDAVVHELQRYVVMLPFGGPLHRVTGGDVYVRGYRLPENAMVFSNLFAVFRDEKVWAEPKSFSPTNFYDEETKTLRNTERLIPFLIGRRACPGESLAKQELFLFFAGVMQRFKLKLDETFVSTEPQNANPFVRVPAPYRVIANARF